MPVRPTPVSKPLNIYKIEINKGALDALPTDVRRNFLLFGHIANEINTLYRLLIFSIKEQSNDVMKLFAESRSFTIARLLIGTTQEGYVALNKHVLSQKFGHTYLPLLNAKGQAALKRVRKHLSDMELMASIRNNFAFHHPTSAQIDNAYARIPHDSDMSIYSGTPRHSSLYTMSLNLMTQGILDCLNDPEDKLSHADAMGQIMDDVIDKSTDLNDFIEALLGTIAEREKLSPHPLSNSNIVLTVDGHESMTSFAIPPLLRT